MNDVLTERDQCYYNNQTDVKETKNMLKRCLIHATKGLKYLHDNDVPHRNLKPTNILQDNDGIWKLSDFGVLYPYGEVRNPLHSIAGPTDNLFSADIHSLGLIMAKIFHPIRSIDHFLSLSKDLIQGNVKLSKLVDTVSWCPIEFDDLILKMVKQVPGARMKIGEVLYSIERHLSEPRITVTIPLMLLRPSTSRGPSIPPGAKNKPRSKIAPVTKVNSREQEKGSKSKSRAKRRASCS